MKKELFLTAVIVSCLLLAGRSETPSASVDRSEDALYRFPLKEPTNPAHLVEPLLLSEPSPLRSMEAAKRKPASREPRSHEKSSESRKKDSGTALEKTLLLLRSGSRDQRLLAGDIERSIQTHALETSDGIFRPEWKAFTDLYAQVIEDELKKQEGYP